MAECASAVLPRRQIKKMYPLAPDTVQFERVDVPPPPVYTSPITGSDDGGVRDYVRKTYWATERFTYDHLVAVFPRIPETGYVGIADLPGRVLMLQQATSVGAIKDTY